MTDKDKVIVLTSTFPRWPKDTTPPFVYELSRRLVSSHEVTVLTPHYPGAKTEEIMAGMTIRRFRYFFNPFEKLAGAQGMLPTLQHNKFYYLLVPLFMLGQMLSLFFLCKKIRPHVIHAHWLIPQGFCAALIAGFFRIPFVVTAHGADIFGLRSYFFKILKKFSLCRTKRVTAVSSALATAIHQDLGYHQQISVLPMGVCAQQFSPAHNFPELKKRYGITEAMLLFVGRLTQKKGVCHLIDAMGQVIQKMPEAKLLVVGGGEEEANIRRQIERMNLGRQVIMVGAVPNAELPAYYATADIFIGPSIQTKGGDTEGFGLTFVEAALSGCLVIGSDVGGIGDIIEHEKTGYLVPPGNAEALAETIIRALQQQEQVTEEMKRQGRAKCLAKYDWPIIAGQYRGLLHAASSSRSVPQ